MRKAISETERAGACRPSTTKSTGSTPRRFRKKVTDILEMIRGRTDDSAPVPAKGAAG